MSGLRWRRLHVVSSRRRRLRKSSSIRRARYDRGSSHRNYAAGLLRALRKDGQMHLGVLCSLPPPSQHFNIEGLVAGLEDHCATVEYLVGATGYKANAVSGSLELQIRLGFVDCRHLGREPRYMQTDIGRQASECDLDGVTAFLSEGVAIPSMNAANKLLRKTQYRNPADGQNGKV